MTQSRSRRIAGELREQIEGRRWEIGDRLPTTRALAQEFGVSLNTINSALRELETLGLVSCQPRRGAFVRARRVGEMPPREPGPRQVALFWSLGTLDRAETDSWHLRIIRAAERVLMEADHPLALMSVPPLANASEEELATRLDHLSGGVAGLICFAQPGVERLLAMADERQIPWVTVNPVGMGWTHNFVSADNAGAGRKLGRCLAAMDFQRVMLLSSDITQAQSSRDRVLGVIQGYLEGGRPLTEVEYVPAADGSERTGYTQARAWLEGASRGRSVIVAAGDYLALGALRACEELGLDVPERVAVVGGTGLETAAVARPPLTVLAQPMEAMGREMAHILIEMIQTGQRRMPGRYVTSPLIARASLAVPERLRAQEQV